ncbi:unnamed protein product [Rotaria socialis]|uniref:Uncharacterized protein n=1 Tax=Rotaria socialis TaxID=392032 RepID=A0A820TFS0_9BILA|nr:unnamed protein product [Rotaria socialis]CAF4467369.1 unnamed protein product [Rotaria socialis]
MAPRKSEKPIQTAPKRSSDSHFNQMSRLNSWNGNSVYPSNSQPNTSVIGQPRFKSLDSSQLVRSNTGRNNEMNKTTTTTTNSEFKYGIFYKLFENGLSQNFRSITINPYPRSLTQE